MGRQEAQWLKGNASLLHTCNNIKAEGLGKSRYLRAKAQLGTFALSALATAWNVASTANIPA